MTRCPQNRTFKNKGLSVRILEPTDQVVVDDIKNFSEDYFRLYFENTGWDVENVTINEGEQFALISFKDHRGSALTVHIRGPILTIYSTWRGPLRRVQIHFCIFND